MENEKDKFPLLQRFNNNSENMRRYIDYVEKHIDGNEEWGICSFQYWLETVKPYEDYMFQTKPQGDKS